MFDYRISKQPHFDEACRRFARNHKISELATRADMNAQTLRNKLNPDQPHQLTAPEIMLLTDLTEDATLVDGFLAQIYCLPCMPVNELAKDKLPVYVMKATAEIGHMADGVISDEVMTQTRKQSMVESANAGMRCLALAALAVDARLKTNPAMSGAVDAMTGIGATFGLL